MRDRIRVVLLAVAFTAQAQAAVVEMDDIRYSVYRLDLDDPAAGPFSRATAINANGLVVGYYRLSSDASNTTSRGFSAPPDATGGYGAATRVTPLTGFSRAFLWDVNDGGTFAGAARINVGDPLYAFVKRPSDPSIPTQPIPGLTGRYSQAKGINNGNAVVGYACPGTADCNAGSGTNRPSAFYFDSGTQTSAAVGLPNLAADASRANAVNDSGLIAGAFANGALATGAAYRAFRYDWSAQQAEDLHPYFGSAVSSEALAINSRGDVAGRVGTTANGSGSGGGNTIQHAFVLEQGSNAPTVLATPTGYQGSAAAAIAENGWVVGTACASGTDCGRFEDTGTNTKPEDNTAVLWANGLAFDLSLLPGLSDAGWAKLSFAESVVDMGEFSVIAGVGYFEFDAGLQRRAFVLRIDESSLPIPEPHTYAMLAAGLVALGALRVRRSQRLAA